jgi:hypothetical protein
MNIQKEEKKTRHLGWHVIGGAIVCVWLAVVLIAWMETNSGETPVDLDHRSLTGLVSESEEWMGIYLHNRRVGRVHSTVKDQEDGFEVSQRFDFNVKVGEIQEPIQLNFEARTGRTMLLGDFNLRLKTGMVSVEANGRMESSGLAVDLSLGQESMHRIIPMKEPPLLDLSFPRLISRQSLRPGARYRIQMFDPQTLSSRPVVIEIVGTEALSRKEGLVPAIHLKRQLGEIKLDTWIDQQGRVLREETALGLTMVREDGESADGAGALDGGSLQADEILNFLRPWIPSAP